MMPEVIPSLRIGLVTLTVNNLDYVRNFYEKILGLIPLHETAGRVALGTEKEVLLVLEEDRNAKRHSIREAGLFHTAFLLPTRGDLARWFLHAHQLGIHLQGASDHLVSEAIYLADPEGNGIEIYKDRPRSDWRWHEGQVEMATIALDIADLVKDADGQSWETVPAATRIGHVHLQVGHIAEAEKFYADKLGFDITCHYPGATFYSTGQYHHHLATNIWNSRNAPPREKNTTGLAQIELIAAEQDIISGIRDRTGNKDSGSLIIEDPWHNKISIKMAF
ncbi:VOC family protein [Microvirga sp. W0021]|uniref:VOC family protein n=1 Tax=Hohaiivirga grylli TaxID=3133970 RepID=A0ABV0BF36_9HYPH